MNIEDWDLPGYGMLESVTVKVPELEQYLPLSQFLGFMVPVDTDPVIVAKLEDIFHQAMQSETIKTFAENQLCIIYDLAGDEAKEMASSIESKLCWVLYDMEQTKFSPEDFGIPKP